MKSYRTKVQIFTPDRIPTEVIEFKVDADTIQNGILRAIEVLTGWGYKQSEYVIQFIAENYNE